MDEQQGLLAAGYLNRAAWPGAELPQANDAVSGAGTALADRHHIPVNLPGTEGFQRTSPHWPPLAPGSLPAAVPFPLEVLPVAMADYARSVARALPCPADLVAVASLGAASAALGNAVHLRVKAGWVEAPRLWALVVSDPGTKKSPALAAATQPPRDAQRDLHHAYRQQCAAAAQAQRSGDASPTVAPPRMRQLFSSDATREGLTALLQDNPRGLALIADEGAGWIKAIGQYKRGQGDDRQFWLSLWGGTPLLVNRARDRGRPTAYVSAPMVSVLGCLPPAALRVLRDEAGLEDGFADRILLAWPEAVPYGWTDEEPAPVVQAAYDTMFRALLALDLPLDPTTGEPQPRILGWTKGGREAWLAYARALADELNSTHLVTPLRGVFAKMEGYAARLALVLHVCRTVTGETASADVDEVSMGGAARLVAYFQAHARRVYAFLSQGRTGTNEDERAVLDWIARHRTEIQTLAPPRFCWRRLRRDLQNRFAGRADDLRLALRHLEGQGYLRQVKAPPPPPRVGRRAEPEYAVHPDLISPGAKAVEHFDTLDT